MTDIIYINDQSIPGPAGPVGPSPLVSIYKKTNATISSGVLSIDASSATTFYVIANQIINSIVVTDWPASGMTQRIAVYVQQDSIGGRLISPSAWPAGTKSPGGIRPNLSPTANAIDCFVMDTFDDGATIFATMVGFNYY